MSLSCEVHPNVIRALIALAMAAGWSFLALPPAAADDLPPITAEERALKKVPGAPEAAAVFLYMKAEFKMLSRRGGSPRHRGVEGL